MRLTFLSIQIEILLTPHALMLVIIIVLTVRDFASDTNPIINVVKETLLAPCARVGETISVGKSIFQAVLNLR
jgi:hypothetical protein